MSWIRDLFITNQLVVFAVYGQAFFTLGVALAVQSMKHTQLRLGRHLRWLAGFGLAHGLVEWGYVFIPIQATYLPVAGIALLQGLQLGLMTLSFVFLLQFGLRTAAVGPLTRPVWNWGVSGGLVGLAALFTSLSVAGGAPGEQALEVSVRYLVAVPGALMAARGTYLAAREVRSIRLPQIGRWLIVSALSFDTYAMLNLITPKHHLFMADWLNYDAVLDWIGVPAQILRTLAGMGILYGILRSLPVFEIETDRLLQSAQHQKLLEAEREVALINQIAITLGRARDQQLALPEVLGQLLPLLRCTAGEIALYAAPEEENPWRLAARQAVDPRPGLPGSPALGGSDGLPAGKVAPDPGHAPVLALPLLPELATADRVLTRSVDGGCLLGIPVRVGQRLVAAIVLRRDQPFDLTEQEAEVLDSLGSLTGVALENSRLWAQVQAKEAARSEWISRVITAQEDERRHIAHELHDGVVQDLVLICRNLDSIDEGCRQMTPAVRAELTRARSQVEGLIATLRVFARDLRPPALDDLGVVASIRRLLADCGARTGIRWHLNVSGDARRLDRDTELGLFRIAQEAIRNAERHAAAQVLAVDMGFHPEEVTLRIVDDGVGIRRGSAARNAHPTGLGMLGMQERAALLGGTLEVQSGRGNGTAITVRVPAAAQTVTL